MVTSKVSFVIPALNEEKGIGETVTQCFAAAKSCGLEEVEVVVVNDGSTDNTASIAEAHGARVVSHPTRAGYGFALKTGIRQASHDAIVITDADGTYPVQDLPKLLAAYDKGFDMVVGARTGEAYRQSVYKDTLRNILRHIVEWAAGKAIADINSGFRIFSRSTVLKYRNHLCDTFSFTTSVTLAYMMCGHFVSYVPIDYMPRIGKSHVRLFRDSLRTLTYITLQILYFNPLKIFFLFSCVCLGISALGFLGSWFLHLNVAYYTGIIGIFSSIITFALGLLSEQIRQLILTTQGETRERQ